MSKLFKITIARVYWDKHAKAHYVLRDQTNFYGYVKKEGSRWMASPSGRKYARLKTLAAAKAHVIKSLATPEGKVRK